MRRIESITIFLKNREIITYNQETICKYFEPFTDGSFLAIRILFEDESTQETYFPSDTIERFVIVREHVPTNL
jgi:hypothetical protein